MKGNFLSFTAARAFVRTLKLKSWKEWREWSKSGMRPPNIPSAPDKVYGDEFISYPDFLGYTGRVGNTSMRPFKAARAFARKLKLESEKEWREWCKSGMRPPNIPSHPDKTYGDEFISWPNFLGYKGRTLADSMRPFKAARAFVRKLKLKSQKAWKEWSKSGTRPANIPSSPEQVYGDEFINYPDFMGYK